MAAGSVNRNKKLSSRIISLHILSEKQTSYTRAPLASTPNHSPSHDPSKPSTHATTSKTKHPLENKRGKKEKRNERTSSAILRSASHSTRGSTLRRKAGLYSMSWRCSSASRKCSGKAAGEALHDLTAQVRKLAVRSFMFASFLGRLMPNSG